MTKNPNRLLAEVQAEVGDTYKGPVNLIVASGTHIGNDSKDLGYSYWGDKKEFNDMIVAGFDDSRTSELCELNPWLDVIREYVQKAIIKHECVEFKYKGAKPHAELEAENLMSTKDETLGMVETALHDLGQRYGRELSEQVSKLYPINDKIKMYNSDESTKHKYETIKFGISELLGLDTDEDIDADPAYKLGDIPGMIGKYAVDKIVSGLGIGPEPERESARLEVD